MQMTTKVQTETFTSITTVATVEAKKKLILPQTPPGG